MGSQAAFIQDQLAYSRRFEREADRAGLQTMAGAGYDPQAMVDMFRTMQRMIALQGGNPPEFLLTHPVTESRISDAQGRVDQMHTDVTRGDSLEYQLVRAEPCWPSMTGIPARPSPDRAAIRCLKTQAAICGH